MLTPISSFAAPYTMNVLIVQQLPIFYDQPWSAGSSIPLEKAAKGEPNRHADSPFPFLLRPDFGYQILTGLSIQLIGMGFAGMCRRFIVYPERES